MTKWKTTSKFEWSQFWKVAQAKLQKFGGVLSGMVIPVIGIIIAWGFLTMFFIPSGFAPVKAIDEIIVGPTINIVIPVLVGFMGGKIFYGERGGVLGAFCAAGAVFAAHWWLENIIYISSPSYDAVSDTFVAGRLTSQNMLMGAMIAGPLSALAFKYLEKLWVHKIPSGYEMLINNFSLAFFAFGAVLASMFGITPLVIYIVYGLGEAVGGLESVNALPVLAIIIEPAKPLFLNNAIGNGTLVPIGLQQVAEKGESILFFAEANPGPGAGMLLGFSIFGTKREKAQAIGALPVHFIGGIHEVYFPFVLTNFALVLPLILAGAFGIGMMQLFTAGLTAPMSPGSVIAAYSMSAHGGLDYAGLSVAIFGSAAISFAGTWFYIKLRKTPTDMDAAAAKMTELKGKESKYVKINKSEIKVVNVACDQGVGSSAIGASTLRKILKKEGFGNIEVVNTPIKALRNDADIVVTSFAFKDAIQKSVPANAHLIVVQNFVGDDNYTEVVSQIREVNKKSTIKEEVVEEKHTTFKFNSKNSLLNVKAKNKEELLKQTGDLLVGSKLVSKEFIPGMIQRDKESTVSIGGGLAIPHGRLEDKKFVKGSGLTIILVPEGIDWDGQTVYVVIGIAAQNDEHMDYIQKIAEKFGDETFAKKLAKCQTIEEMNGALN